MRTTTLILTVLLAWWLGPARAQTIRETFAGHLVTFEAPEGYRALPRQSPNQAVLLLGYDQARRGDCVSAALTFTLVDLSETAGGDTLSLEGFAASMLGAIQSRHSNWTVTDSTAEVVGISAIRYHWSGVSVPPPRSPCKESSIPMRGVMIVGITDGLAFALQARDREASAAGTITTGEAVSRTLRIQAAP
jgi:hypothetical protein